MEIKEQEVFKDVVIGENQIEDGILYNTVTTDDTEQDQTNTDDINELLDDSVVVENVEVSTDEHENK